MLVATLQWRERFDVAAAVAEVFPDEVFGTVGNIAGHDKEGRPVVYAFCIIAQDQVLNPDAASVTTYMGPIKLLSAMFLGSFGMFPSDPLSEL